MKALVFDVYGTLFDVGSLAEACRTLVPEPEAFVSGWRAKQLEYTFWRSLMGRYENFERITAEALRGVVNLFGLTQFWYVEEAVSLLFPLKLLRLSRDLLPTLKSVP